MHLYHPTLINYLPSQLLITLHRDCCAIRGNGWGRGNGPSTRWIWMYPYSSLVQYHHLVLNEMQRRNFKPDPHWWEFGYRGKKWKAKKTIEQLNIPENPYFSPTFKEMTDQKLCRDKKKIDGWMERKRPSPVDIVRWGQA